MLAAPVPQPTTAPMGAAALDLRSPVASEPPTSAAGSATAVLTAATPLTTRPATTDDLGELFTLQQAAAAADALRARGLDATAIHESFAEASARFASSEIRVAVDGTRLVGALIHPPGDHSAGDALLVAPDQDQDTVAAILLGPSTT